MNNLSWREVVDAIAKERAEQWSVQRETGMLNERLATVKTLQEIAKRQPPGAFRTFLCDLADHFITGKHRGS